MNQLRERNIDLSDKDIKKIKNWGENVFAKACLQKEHLKVTYQIPVGTKVIDFLVKNQKLNGKSKGILVEVTSASSSKADKKSQIEAMQQSGQPNTVLYGENLVKIQASLRKSENGS